MKLKQRSENGEDMSITRPLKRRKGTTTGSRGTLSPLSDSRRHNNTNNNSNNDPKLAWKQEEPPKLLDFMGLPQEVRLCIVQYIDDLAEYACVLKQCLEDRNHPSLPDIPRWAKLIIRPGIEVTQILTTLNHANEWGVFDTFDGLIIEYSHPDNMKSATIADVRHQLNSIRLDTVTRLELKAPKDKHTHRPLKIPNCVPSFLSKICRIYDLSLFKPIATSMRRLILHRIVRIRLKRFAGLVRG